MLTPCRSGRFSCQRSSVTKRTCNRPSLLSDVVYNQNIGTSGNLPDLNRPAATTPFCFPTSSSPTPFLTETGPWAGPTIWLGKVSHPFELWGCKSILWAHYFSPNRLLIHVRVPVTSTLRKEVPCVFVPFTSSWHRKWGALGPDQATSPTFQLSQFPEERPGVLVVLERADSRQARSFFAPHPWSCSSPAMWDRLAGQQVQQCGTSAQRGPFFWGLACAPAHPLLNVVIRLFLRAQFLAKPLPCCVHWLCPHGKTKNPGCKIALRPF